MYIAEFETKVAGIPCMIGVIRFDSEAGSYSHNAPSDVDYYGYTESEWDLLDRRGRPAPWLDRKLTREMVEQVEREIKTHFEG